MHMPGTGVDTMPGLPLAVAAPLGAGSAWGDAPARRAPTMEDWLVAVDQCADIEQALRCLDPWDDEQRSALRVEHRDWSRERDAIARRLTF